jgi:hypothetical protein
MLYTGSIRRMIMHERTNERMNEWIWLWNCLWWVTDEGYDYWWWKWLMKIIIYDILLRLLLSFVFFFNYQHNTSNYQYNILNKKLKSVLKRLFSMIIISHILITLYPPKTPEEEKKSHKNFINSVILKIGVQTRQDKAKQALISLVIIPPSVGIFILSLIDFKIYFLNHASDSVSKRITWFSNLYKTYLFWQSKQRNRQIRFIAPIEKLHLMLNLILYQPISWEYLGILRFFFTLRGQNSFQTV